MGKTSFQKFILRTQNISWWQKAWPNQTILPDFEEVVKRFIVLDLWASKSISADPYKVSIKFSAWVKKWKNPKNDQTSLDWIQFFRDLFSRIFEMQKLPSKHLLVFKTSWRRLQDMSWKRLQHVLSVKIFGLPRRLEDVLKKSCKYVLKMSWRHLAKRFSDVFEDMFWRRLVNIS